MDIKVGPPITTLDKRNKSTSKKIDDDLMSENFEVFAVFFNLSPIWSNPEAGFRMHSVKNLHFN